jgi:hypothetical protein
MGNWIKSGSGKGNKAIDENHRVLRTPESPVAKRHVETAGTRDMRMTMQVPAILYPFSIVHENLCSVTESGTPFGSMLGLL